ncbi:unnamed protein product [marine sediment metagenome]|uniref:Uncharacterized protein n=1 Tax=marine sediment metagenome TaxID=412755 RepID=X1RAR4_9ZZZZ
MPKIGTKVLEGADDVRIGVVYTILMVEEVETDVAKYHGLRVGLIDKDKDEGSVMLWQRPITSPRSKLGSFLTLLENDTDKWTGKKIIFKDWRPGARLVELVK